jgi:heme oxygenase (biliverdin-IX-beta and delta-forming)
MWHAFRRATRARATHVGDPAAMLGAAIGTFRSLAEWCRPTAVAA